jgi:hypothetical protein
MRLAADVLDLVLMYRHYGLKYTIDSLCGLKFRHAVGSLIPAVGLKFIQLYCTPYSGLAAGCRLAGCCWLYSRYQRPEAYCGLLYSGCGPEVSWEIPAVAYSPVYFRP